MRAGAHDGEGCCSKARSGCARAAEGTHSLRVRADARSNFAIWPAWSGACRSRRSVRPRRSQAGLHSRLAPSWVLPHARTIAGQDARARAAISGTCGVGSMGGL